MHHEVRLSHFKKGCFNITFTSHATRARLLSNFARTPFHLQEGARRVLFASMEGFIQGIKFPPSEYARTSAFGTAGYAAKEYGKLAGGEYVYWSDETISWRSARHIELIEHALRAKFAENAECVQALLATRGQTLIHETGEPESKNTSLPASTFCELLTKIRDDFLKHEPKSIHTPRHVRAIP